MQGISLVDRVAIVTGARRGLGEAYALELAQRGAKVVVNGTPHSPGLDDVVARIVDAGGVAIASPNDIATRPGGQAVIDDAINAFGQLDILINNAGILRTGYFEDLDDRNIDDIMDIHLKSLFYVTQPAMARMRSAGYGRIVNTSSNTAFGMLGLASYAAAKAGVIGFTKSLALEGADAGVLVNCVMPNAATPAMDNDPIPGFDEDTRFAAAFAGISDRFRTDLITPLVAYLASSQCSTTGEAYSSLGGRFARVFYGVTEGWLASEEKVSAEDISAHFDEINELGEFMVPEKIRDEFESVAERSARRSFR